MEQGDRQDFLKELQSLTEPTKKKILVISTIVIMLVIVFVWVKYFNSIVAPSAGDMQQSQPAIAAPAPAAPAAGFWSQMGMGFSQFGSGIATGFKWFSGIFGMPHTYTIQPSH